jgi:anti-sigma factor RsiW
MSECHRTTDRLASYVDNVLPPSERAEVDRHLAQCAACRLAAVQEQGARTILRNRAAELRSAPLPPGFRTRLEALGREQTRTTATVPFWRRRLVPLALTAVLVAFTVFGVFSLATQRSNTLFAAQLTADHVKCVKEVRGPDTASADASRLESLLLEEYGWNVHVPPSSAPDGVELIGARRCQYGGGLVPHVVYRMGGQDVSLYMIEGVTRGEADVVTLGYRSRVWSRGATTFVLVSPAEAGDLPAAVAYLQQEAY